LRFAIDGDFTLMRLDNFLEMAEPRPYYAKLGNGGKNYRKWGKVGFAELAFSF
jgi:hypothetical protein